MAKKAVKVIEYLLMAVLAVALIYFALKGIEWSVFLDNLGEVRWGYVLLSMAAYLAAMLLRNERWRDLVLPLDPGISRIKSWDAANLGNLSYFVIPAGTEFIRCGALTTKKASYDKVFGTMLMERAWDIIMVVVITLLAIVLKSSIILNYIKDEILAPFESRMSWQLWVLLGALVVAVVVFLVLVYRMRERNAFFGKVAGWIDGIFSGFKTFVHLEKKGKFILCSAGVWLMYVATCQFTFWAIPSLSSLDFADALFISAVGNLTSLIPVPGGMGAYHYLVASALAQIYGASWEIGILFATLTHESRSILLLVTGAASVVNMSIAKRRTSVDNL